MELNVTGNVIAPGGSVVLYEDAISFLKQSGTVVFLHVPIDIIKPRINFLNRGTVRNPGQTLDDVWSYREPLYRKYADVIIDCGRMEQTEIVSRIIENFNTKEINNSRRTTTKEFLREIDESGDHHE